MTHTMTIFDQIVLGATGLVALYLIVRLVQDSKRAGNPIYNYLYIASMAVILVSGLLLIIYGYDILPNAEVIVVTTLIPIGISTGLVYEFHSKYAKGYLIFAIVGLIAITLTRYIGADNESYKTLRIITLATFHGVFGLTIFFIPIFLVKAKKAVTGFIGVTVGGALIGIGGLSLAFLKLDNPILSANLILTILASLLLLMALGYTWGFVKKIKAVE